MARCRHRGALDEAELTAAIKAAPSPDESLALNERGDLQQRLEDLGDGRIASMDEQALMCRSSR
jgi:hypothetical protein